MAKGKSANTTGNQLEIAVLTVLSNKGFEIEMYRVWEKNPEKYGEELLLKNVHGNCKYMKHISDNADMIWNLLFKLDNKIFKKKNFKQTKNTANQRHHPGLK